MKINKKFLQRIIKEEIARAIEDEETKRDVIHAYIQAIGDAGMNVEKGSEPEKDLYNRLQNIGVDPLEALNMLSREEVDPDFYVNASHMHNAMVRMTGEGEEIMIDAFQDFPKTMADPYKDPDPNFMRSPRTGQSRDYLDTRKDRKNLTQG
jgi:hypothetical protein